MTNSRNMKSSLIIYLLCAHFILNAQLPKRPYEKISFNTTQPVWYETFYDTRLINELCDGYKSFSIRTTLDPLIKEDYIITIRGVLNRPKAHDGGALIQKRDKTNGSLIWSILYDYNNQPYPEIPFKMYIGEDGFLHVHGFRDRIDAAPELFPFLYVHKDSCLLTYRKIDLVTGEIVEFFTPDEQNEKALMVLASVDRSKKYSNLLRTDDPEIFVYWERIILPDRDVATIHFRKVNKYGLAVSELDSFRLRTPTNGLINIIQLSTDTIIHVNFNRINQKITLYIYNNSFELKDSIRMNDLPFPFNQNASADLVDGNSLLIRTLDVTLDYYRFFDAAYSLDGKLINYYEQKSYNYIPYWSSYDPFRKKLLVMSSGQSNNPFKYSTTLFESVGNGELKKIHEFVPIDTLRTINGLLVFTLDKDKTLIHFSEGSFYVDQDNYVRFDDNARAQSLMLFNAADIGLNTVSSQDTEFEDMTMLVFPNPGHNHVTLTWRLPTTGNLAVYNIWGNEIYQQELIEADYTHMQTTTWPSGAYIFVLTDGASGVHTSVKWLKD
jgi:hypothetical protein